MRPPKSRTRSKNNNNNNNRNRSVGNVVNRVFDSSGPEGKVRGTPQQIIEKYTQLARDAHLSNDRVAVENFQQHSEHYTRMLGEAMREMEVKREQQELEQRERQAAQPQTQSQQPQTHSQQPRREDNSQNRNERVAPPAGDQQQERPDRQQERTDQQPFEGHAPAFVSNQPEASNRTQEKQPEPEPQAQNLDVGLVETPEEAPAKRAPRARKPRAKPAAAATESPDTPKAAE